VKDRPKQEREVIPVVEEQAVILKRKRLTGGVRVRTVVREEEEVVDEPLTSEDVDVERVPLERWVDGPVPVRQEGDTTILTLTEEVVVLEKRIRAIEEVRITKRQTVRHEPQTVTLRREEAVIERLATDGSEQDPD
jgi:stress response protein YsnF